MKNIILVCAAGMSTSLLVNKMRNAAGAAAIDVHIEAMPAIPQPQPPPASPSFPPTRNVPTSYNLPMHSIPPRDIS